MTVFISREIDEDSFFYKKLRERGVDINGQSLVVFSPLSFHLPAAFDWLFFYSKTGAEYFFKRIGTEPIFAKIAALGPGTASAILEFGKRKADFVGDGTPEQNAKDFKITAAGQTVLFVRAADSRQSVQTLLKDAVAVLEIVVYENKIVENVPEINADILVFTSTLNARAYLNRHSLKAYQQVVAIGKPTAEALQELGVKKVAMAVSPYESALADAVLMLL